jgi:hypothetical protein
LAAETSLWAVLRRTSASSRAWAEVMPEARRVFRRSSARVDWSRAWLGGARGFLGRHQAVADRGLVELDQHVAALDRLAVLLQHLQDHGRDFGAQVGLAFRLDRAGDHRAGSQRIALHRQHVFRRHQQLDGLAVLLGVGLRSRSVRLGGFLAAFAAGGERRGDGKDE